MALMPPKRESVKLLVFMDEGSMGSLKVAITDVSIATPVAPLAGAIAVTDGDEAMARADKMDIINIERKSVNNRLKGEIMDVPQKLSVKIGKTYSPHQNSASYDNRNLDLFLSVFAFNAKTPQRWSFCSDYICIKCLIPITVSRYPFLRLGGKGMGFAKHDCPSCAFSVDSILCN